jgi:hypothetical protein
MLDDGGRGFEFLGRSFFSIFSVVVFGPTWQIRLVGHTHRGRSVGGGSVARMSYMQSGEPTCQYVRSAWHAWHISKTADVAVQSFQYFDIS